MVSLQRLFTASVIIKVDTNKEYIHLYLQLSATVETDIKKQAAKKKKEEGKIGTLEK